MYDHSLYQQVNDVIKKELDIAGKDNLFYTRFLANASAIQDLYQSIYRNHSSGGLAFRQLLQTILNGYKARPKELKERDLSKIEKGSGFLATK